MLSKMTIVDNKPFSDFSIDFSKQNKINVALWDEVDFELVFIPFSRVTAKDKYSFETFTSVHRSVENFRYTLKSPETKNQVMVDFEFTNKTPFSADREDELDEIEDLKDFVQALLNKYYVGKPTEGNKYIFALYILQTLGAKTELEKKYFAQMKFELKRMYLVLDALISNSLSKPLMSKFIYFDIEEYKTIGRSSRFDFDTKSKYIHTQFLSQHLRQIVLNGEVSNSEMDHFMNQLNLRLKETFEQITNHKYEVLEILLDRKSEIKIRVDNLIKSINELTDTERLAIFFFIHEPFMDIYEISVVRNLHKEISTKVLESTVDYLDKHQLSTILSFSESDAVPTKLWRNAEVPYLFIDRYLDTQKSHTVGVKVIPFDDTLIEQWLSLKIGFTLHEEEKSVYIFSDKPETAISLRRQLNLTDKLTEENKDEVTVHYIRDIWAINDPNLFDKQKFEHAKIIFAIGNKERLTEYQSMLLNDTKISKGAKQEIVFSLLDSDEAISARDLHKLETIINFTLSPKSNEELQREQRAKVRLEKQRLRGW